jgi:methylmalonic aciduria homocystinuria type C protein
LVLQYVFLLVKTYNWRSIVSNNLRASGLDISKALQVGWYNQSIAVEHRLPDFGNPVSLALLIGNTRKIWAPFLAWLADDHLRLELSNPLESYVEMTIGKTFGELDVPHRIRFSHHPEPYHIAFQQLAEVAGLAWRSPAHLSVHPEYGCWIALRAVVVIDLPGPCGQQPGMEPLCRDCMSGCLPELDKVFGNSHGAMPGYQDVAASWQDWLAIRDACSIGKNYRYSDDQIRYHYIKDRNFLKSLIEAVPD